jgi:hypothetical protein
MRVVNVHWPMVEQSIIIIVDYCINVAVSFISLLLLRLFLATFALRLTNANLLRECLLFQSRFMHGNHFVCSDS